MMPNTLAARALLRKARGRRADAAAVGPVPSPCCSVCRIDASSGWCEGCLRTLDEIASWSTLADHARETIWIAIEQRASTLLADAVRKDER